ncbi:leukotriene C4 synthase isoform X3 [Oryctolagus cuniculus]|uniref:leukotriene C4 synthase isoform X3 n=1 Tax=Oryctolagus cuniculus TaxID=9986 RepID=UPI00387A4DB7
MKDEIALLATVTLLGVLLQGDLRQKSLPRVAAAHHWSAGIRARLPSPGELQRVLPAVPRSALGRRHLLSRRRRGPLRPGLPVRALPLLPQLRALGGAQAGPDVPERGCALAVDRAGGARPALALPPGPAARRAAWLAPDAAALGLRPGLPD